MTVIRGNPTRRGKRLRGRELTDTWGWLTKPAAHPRPLLRREFPDRSAQPLTLIQRRVFALISSEGIGSVLSSLSACGLVRRAGHGKWVRV